MPERSVRVAVIDDDPSVCKALARLLRANGLVVDTYGSAQAFLGSLDLRLPECLVADLQMPEMTGLELQRHLVMAGFRIPTIIITAHDVTGTRERCLSEGAAAYLVKPLREEALLQSIDAAVSPASRSAME